jgi:tetratricopeptide (TPR) repeat protein
VIGEILSNRYRILREIGSGGMAWVYLAEDMTDNRLVAVKILYPQFGEDTTYTQRFRREAKLALGLSDPHIVRVLDYGASRDVHYLVMEYIQGKNLREYIEERGSLPYEEALNIADQVAAALERAHQLGIVHRDIKPQNLMITPDGTVKVLDFGIARVRSLPSLTQSGFVGSPYYISPEQAMGEEVDIRSDIYSLGVVLYEMLSGRLPFDAKSPWSIISQHIATEPPMIVLPEGTLLPDVERLVRKALAKPPEGRFQTPTEMRQAIADILAGKPLPKAEAEVFEAPARQVLLADLYQRALKASQAGEWQRAVDLLNQVLLLAPHYLDASHKLAEAGRQARLAALYAAGNRALEAGRWQEAADEFSEILSVDATYSGASEGLAKAQQALAEAEERQKAVALYAEGLAYYEAGKWAEAIECLSQVEQLLPGYGRAAAALHEAQERLRGTGALRQGRAAVSAAMGRLTGREAALSAEGRRGVRWFLVGLAVVLLLLCGGLLMIIRGMQEEAPSATASLAQDYSLAQNNLPRGDKDEAIALLEKIVVADPGYDEGKAVSLLYRAYLDRGDERRKAGDLKGALQDYQKALTLPVDDRRDAEERQAAVLRQLSTPVTTPATVAVAPSATVAGTANLTPIATPTSGLPTATHTPTATSTRRPSRATPTPTKMAFKYPAPRLLLPENGRSEIRRNASFVAQWEPVGDLAPDEYYRVYFESHADSPEGPVVWGDYLTTKTPGLNGERGQGDWEFMKWSLGVPPNNRSTVYVLWWVTVMKQTGTDEGGKRTGPDISPPSDKWVIKLYAD